MLKLPIFRLNIFIICICLAEAAAGQKASITVETREILTYPYSDPNPVPVLADKKSEIYPYFTFNGYSLKGKMQNWKVVKLENDYVEVYVLPEVGGKVWGAIEKSTGKEFIYRNEVLKFRNIAMRGPWTSGGIEFNFGIIGHNPSTCVPVDYKTKKNDDGSVSCFMGSLDLPSRTRWCVEIRLPADRAWFETFATWINPTPLTQTYYNWMTAAARVTDDLEFAYPGTAEIGHEGEFGLWPVNAEGRNVAWYRENNFGSSKSYHVVGEYNDFMGGYYQKSEFGFGHWALYDEMPGHKLWLWSLARDGGIWEDLLTDSDGQYMEFQAGRMFNQYGGTSAFKTPISQTAFNPGLTDRWHEIWFPVKGTGGISDVSPLGVLYASAVNDSLKIGINAFLKVQGRLIVKSGGKEILSKEVNFKPMDTFTTSVSLNAPADYEVVVEGMDLHFSPSVRQLLKRPFVSSMPKDLITEASLYQEGMQLKNQRNYSKAGEAFKKCLEADPLYIDAYASMSEILYRSVKYDSALYYANKALQLDTYHPSANYFAGLIYMAEGDLTDALESLGWAARSMEYRSNAYSLMAEIGLRKNEIQLAEHYASLSLDFNSTNLNAVQLLAILYRKSGENDKANQDLESIRKIDPLGHFSDFESYLQDPSSDNLSRFSSTITNELQYQTYLELCIYYYDLGLKNEALSVLEKAPVHPLVCLWKAFLSDDHSSLIEASNASPAFVFPYRTETVKALEWAVSKNTSWKFRYYLALNYAAVQRMEEAMKLLRGCGLEPDYAPFYLTRASMIGPGEGKGELADLLQAKRLAPDDWRVSARLIDYYVSDNDSQSALAEAKEAYSRNKDNTLLGIRYAAALINTSQYTASLKVLESMNILPNEGSSQGKEVFEQACLFQSLELIKKNKYSEAIVMIEKSKEWPENLGVGKPFKPDIRIQDRLEAFCLEKLNRKAEAETLRKAGKDIMNDKYSRILNEMQKIGIY